MIQFHITTNITTEGMTKKVRFGLLLTAGTFGNKLCVYMGMRFLYCFYLSKIFKVSGGALFPTGKSQCVFRAFSKGQSTCCYTPKDTPNSFGQLGRGEGVRDICKAATGDPYSSTKGLGHFV